MTIDTNTHRRLAWLDLETTGFTELSSGLVYRQFILEAAALVTDEQFNVLAQMSVVISHPIGDVLKACDGVVLKMHTENGLLQDVSESLTSMQLAEQQLIGFLQQNGVSIGSSPLCGNGVHLDRTFIEVHMPTLNRHLHYRNLDISAVKEFIKVIAPGHEPAKKATHRALDDILESAAEARSYRSLLEPALV